MDDTDNMDRVCNLLEYIGLNEDDLEKVYYTINYWSFIISLAEQFEESGSLSVKQRQSLESLILKHTGAVCNATVLTHQEQYKRKGKRNKSVSNRVQHEFGELLDIQLFDLPYESGSEQTEEFHPYNRHTTVVQLKGRFYRLPLPVKWNKLTEVTKVTFKYKRTVCKGYMQIVDKDY